jgi:hypothetical protein
MLLSFGVNTIDIAKKFEVHFTPAYNINPSAFYKVEV